FPKITVGATENVLMAAVLAKGDTIISNAAREPEVTDLAICLKSMGAEIEGIGTNKLKVFGVRSLHGTSHKVIPDRIETGTYAIAASITGGDLVLRNVQTNNNQGLLCALSKAGVETSELDGALRVSSKREKLRGINLTTEPFPGFPTDMQAQFMALMCLANGKSQITESIFENRFMHVPELVRMGANISVSGASALVQGVAKMSAAQVMATDLRASVSLILAGLAIDGETLLNRVYHLDRGYERLEEKLAACGAEIKRVK
ncbi:MAG: UDP-N-acetylglucosamine 1-carboxyvinyltransferase, partial [Alphaproteobacteria bacterium MarineAlpha3_Bin5]